MLRIVNIRRASQALAIAAIAAVTLAVTTASAAPSVGHSPVDPSESYAKRQVVHLLRSDLSIESKGHWSDVPGGYSSYTFAFHVENHGPDATDATATMRVNRAYCQKPDAPSCHIGDDLFTKTMTLASGESREIVAPCPYPYCVVFAEVKSDKALDPNLDNNLTTDMIYHSN